MIEKYRICNYYQSFSTTLSSTFVVLKLLKYGNKKEKKEVSLTNSVMIEIQNVFLSQ